MRARLYLEFHFLIMCELVFRRFFFIIEHGHISLPFYVVLSMKDIYKPLNRIASRTMNRRTPIYEGKAKQLFEGPEPGTLIKHFKDDATAFNNAKKGVINGKGVINNRISEYLMLKLGEM